MGGFLPRKRKGKYSKAHGICLEKCDDYSKRFWSTGCKSSKKISFVSGNVSSRDQRLTIKLLS
jgi:hypothetical protein